MSGGKYQDKPNTGVLFGQRDKKSDRAPDFTGNLVLGEDVLEAIRRGTSPMVKVRLAGWKKTSDKVGVYLSLSVSADEDKRNSAPRQTGGQRPSYQQRRSNQNDDEHNPWE